ncbi:MAG TPA: hypothetical protein PKA20_13975 [Burkholderiaceae bacterium]|nr:hypothetical protein [Burkholderiaceae bacterium]
MDRAAAQIETLQALELRVSSGPQRGARAPLDQGRPFLLTTEDDAAADIVLSGNGEAARVRLIAELPAGSIEVLQGKARLGNRELAAGQQTEWPAGTPLTIGSSAVAFGLACVDRWAGSATTDSDESADQPVSGKSGKNGKAADDRASQAAFAAATRRASAPAKKGLAQRADLWLAAAGATVLLICGGAMGVAHYGARAATPVVAADADPVSRFADQLRGSEFPDLQIVTRGNGQIVLRGRLTTVEQRERLDQWLATAAFKPTIEVIVEETLAREVSEIFRINGIDADAQVAGRGRVVAQVSERDTAGLARAEEAVRRDVRGLESLEVRNTAKPVPPPPAPVNTDPGKRIASLVPGATAYLVTADGSRYFVGATLPTGHRIVKIGAATVALERDGEKTSLNF